MNCPQCNIPLTGCNGPPYCDKCGYVKDYLLHVAEEARNACGKHEGSARVIANCRADDLFAILSRFIEQNSECKHERVIDGKCDQCGRAFAEGPLIS